MENKLTDPEREIQSLQDRVHELERQLAEARAAIGDVSSGGELTPTDSTQQRAEELNAIIQALHDPVMVYDQNGVIYMANASAVRAHGFDPTQHHRQETNQALVIRCSNGEIADSEKLPSARALKGETVIDEPLIITNSNGQELSILVTSSPLIVNGVQKGAVSIWRDVTGQREAEKAKELALEQAEEGNLLLQALLDFIPEGICITGGAPDFAIKRISHYGLEMTANLDASRVIGVPVGQHQYPLGLLLSDGVTEPSAEETPLYRAAYFGEVILNKEMVLRTQDGVKTPILILAAPIRNAQGQIIAAINSWRDFTEVKQLEERLRTARDQAMWLARLPGENPNPVARVSDAGIVLYHNRPAATLPGWMCVLNEPLPMPLRALVLQAMSQGQMVEQDLLLGRKYYLVSIVPIPDEGYANIYGRDITEHKRAQEELRESERRQRELSRLLELDQVRLASVLRHLPVGVWIVDQQGRLTGNNPEADRIWAGEAPLLNSIAEFQKYLSWHSESGELLKPEEYPVALALQTGEPVEPMELNIRRFDGSEGTVLASAAPIKNGLGQLMGAVGVNVDITERKQMEEALRRSEERFEKAFRETPDAIIISRMSDGLIIEANEGWQKLFGHNPKDVIGRTSVTLGVYVNPEDRKTAIARLQEKGVLKDFEIQVRNQSGEIRQASMSAERIEIDGVDCLLTIMRDITEWKQFEQALRRSEERLTRAQEIAHLGSWELVLVNNQLTWSDEVYRIFGLQPQEFDATYEAFLEAVHPDDRSAVDQAYSNSIREGRDYYEIEHRVVKHSTGEVRIVHEKCSHFRDSSGQIIRSIGMVQDITERKQAEEALQESEQRFRSLADSMPQLVWTALPDGTVDYYNSRYQEYQEIKQINRADWEWAPVLHPDDLQPTVDAWQNAVKTGEVYQIEHRVRMANGSYRWHLSRGLPVFHENGQIVRWFGTATDIHDVKLAEEQLKDYAERLERSNRELEQFAFMASHDLQEPLRKIEMFGDLLMERATSLNERERNHLDRMRNAASRMRDMITGLLQLSRITTQGMPFARVGLSQITAEVLSDMESEIERFGGKVSYSDLPVVEGDPMQLRQLMQNLISNALKYHQLNKPPEVKIYAKHLPEKVQIFVEDQGIGFEQEEAERVFQPFQRLVGRSEYEGSGIGLAICRRIVERHAGDITAQSQLGRGTTFIITLPIAHPGSAKGDFKKDTTHNATPDTAPGR